ncbi:hypothetical protein DFH07DRAFT_2610 [Mycena maculata]|uniref:BTB domain-containing protein n=1 Tax=Mycena maculata TaxID=230809 RepID=A0AAD7P2H1_9AGAR|nr:hypothetical protein DFH07DRAFT_2610 [Mycena maculata]
MSVSTTEKLVPRPPFSESTTDLILRSSDGIDFHVYRVVLCLASSVFRDMVGLAQPEDENMPTVRMAESGVVLDRILRFWYPGSEPVVENLGQLREILELLIDKYDVKAVVPVGKQFLRGYIESQPVGVFAVAARHGWEDLAFSAAQESLRLPLRSSSYRPPDELKYVSGIIHHSLIQYHYRCGEAARKACVCFIQSPPNWAYKLFDCTCTTHSDVTVWFFDYVHSFGDLVALTPSDRNAHDLMAKALKEATKCKTCSGAAHDGFPSFVSIKLLPLLAAKIAEVNLNLNGLGENDVPRSAPARIRKPRF